MNPTSIDWPGLTHTWNPGYGCKRGCHFCYAKDLHDKRMEAKKRGKKVPKQYDKPFNQMQFFPERLKIVKKSSVVKKVFVGSMTDICYWKPNWMERVLDVIRERPGIEFMFLTKGPEVYKNYDFPKNCWLGETRVDEHYIGDDGFLIKKPNRIFVSAEPILGSFKTADFEHVDLVIVGADSRKGAAPPKQEWIESIKHHHIHYKENVRKYLYS